MNDWREYQELTDNYRKLIQFGKNLALSSGMIQFAAIIFINSWKHLKIPHCKPAATILFSLCIYQFIKDFATFLKLDKHMVLTVLNGLELEKKNISLGKFFHDILWKFNLTKILVQRSLVNLCAFFCLGYFVSRLALELIIGYGSLFFISSIFTTIACKFYYTSLESLAKAKLLKKKA